MQVCYDTASSGKEKRVPPMKDFVLQATCLLNLQEVRVTELFAVNDSIPLHALTSFAR